MFSGGHWLIEEHEFIAIENQATEVGQTMFLRVNEQIPGFLLRGRSSEGQLIHHCDLAGQVRTHPADALREPLALAHNKVVVQHGERLERRDRSAADWSELRSVRAIQRVHERVWQG